jgi:HTH-type transcriptional regulator/antitoxin HigA
MKNQISSKLPKDYKGLLARQMLRPLHDRIDHENALEILESMAGYELNRDQDDYFEALSLLVEAYESAQLPPFRARKGVALLKHLLEECQWSATDLARLLGTDRSLGIRILNGERNLTVDHIKKLAIHFRVPAQIFLA